MQERSRHITNISDFVGPTTALRLELATLMVPSDHEPCVGSKLDGLFGRSISTNFPQLRDQQISMKRRPLKLKLASSTTCHLSMIRQPYRVQKERNSGNPPNEFYCFWPQSRPQVLWHITGCPDSPTTALDLYSLAMYAHLFPQSAFE